MRKSTFHILALAHQPVTHQVTSCAFTTKVMNACFMLKQAGHRVLLYGAGSHTDAAVDEYFPCVKDETLVRHFGPMFASQHNNAGTSHQAWREFVQTASRKVAQNLTDDVDFVLCSYGNLHAQCCPSESAAIIIEMGVSYQGVFARRKIFESYSWQHYVYGRTTWTEQHKGSDVVIPMSIQPEYFIDEPLKKRKGYALCLGRAQIDKGIEWAYYAAKEAGVDLVIAGAGNDDWLHKNFPDVIYKGNVTGEERKELLANAEAVMCLTQGIEPFGPTAIEAAYSGTPVISTDWGGFVETVMSGQTGYRVRSPQGAAVALKSIYEIKPDVCREWGKRFTIDAVWPLYENYFERQLAEYGA